MTTARFIDIHILHTVPYANLNRDDLGSPKSVYYGGATRTRVSSQCWKRAVRLEMEDQLGDPAARTRRIAIEVAERLSAEGWSAELAEFAGQQVAAAALSDGLTLDKGLSQVLLYLPKSSFDDLAAMCVEYRDDLMAAQAAAGAKAKAKKGKTVLPRERVNAAISGRNGIINLFGRMLAEMPSANVDGAVQVAHAFTTHTTETEIDFFTAVDDLNPSEDTGSGHMNGAEFSAGTFYRYACVNLADLTANLDSDRVAATELAKMFLNKFIVAMPGAKKNSTAPFTVPELAYVSVRSDRPVSLASAFERPVRYAAEGGYGLRSRQELAGYAGQIYRLLGAEGRLFHGHASVDEKAIELLGTRTDSFRDLVDAAVSVGTE